jgi:hypothetical protein
MAKFNEPVSGVIWALMGKPIFFSESELQECLD